MEVLFENTYILDNITFCSKKLFLQLSGSKSPSQEEKLCWKFDICHPGRIFSFHESFRTNPPNQEVYPVLMRDVDTFHKTEKFDTLFIVMKYFRRPGPRSRGELVWTNFHCLLCVGLTGFFIFWTILLLRSVFLSHKSLGCSIYINSKFYRRGLFCLGQLL